MLDAVATDVPVAPPEPVRRPRHTRNWGLEAMGDELWFVAAPIDDPPPSHRRGDCVPLADGDVLAIVARGDGFSGLECFLRLHPDGSGWQVIELGMIYRFCVGSWWVERSKGTVTIDARSPGALACQVDVVGETPWGDPHHPMNAEFWIDPESDSLELRGRMARFRGGPALR